MKKFYLGAGIVVIAIVLFNVFAAVVKKIEQPRNLATYFSYTAEELSPLRGLASKNEVTIDDVYRWDQAAFDIVRGEDMAAGSGLDTTKVYAYLAIAQRDAAYLSFNVKQKFSGSLDPVSKEVLCIFFIDRFKDIPSLHTDEYSQALAKVVLAKVKERIAQDDAQMHPYSAKIGPEYWDGPEPRVGIAEGSLKPWFIESGDQFRAPPPPAFGSPEFQEQLFIIQKARREATDEQKQKVVFWAGGPGTKTPPGIWLNIADTYKQENKTPLEKVLAARSLLMAAMADANIAVFDSKYTYWVRRPNMMDPSMITIMPTPNHPSYPAGHSCLSSAAKIVLIHFFPEAVEQWSALGEEGGLSRIWGGIHYIMDHAASVNIGESVGRSAISKLP